jgi:hypothetical protein
MKNLKAVGLDRIRVSQVVTKVTQVFGEQHDTNEMRVMTRSAD